MTTLTMERPTIAEPIAMVRAPYVAPQADLSQTKSPGTVESKEGEAETPEVEWSNPENAKSEDGASAAAELTYPNSTELLRASNFAFGIPEGATMLGILVNPKISANKDGVVDWVAQLLKAGEAVGFNKKQAPYWSPAAGLHYRTYGGGDDLWGDSWTPADINASGFGFVLQAQTLVASGFKEYKVNVDHIQITVYYTEAGDDENHVCAQGRSIDFRTEGVFRQHPEDDVWGELVNEGFNLQAPPSFLEGRALRAIITPSTGDLEALADSGTHDIEVVVKYRPAYHFAREAIDHGS